MRYLVILTLIVTFASSCQQSGKKKEVSDTTTLVTPDTAGTRTDTTAPRGGGITNEDGILPAAREIVNWLKAKSFDRIADYVSPAHGLRFSTNGYIEKDDIGFTKEQVAGLWESTATYLMPTFNEEDTTKITFRKYYEGEVYDKDFAKASGVQLNKLQRGPTPGLFRLADTYPSASHVDFYIPAPSDSELDWATLRLVFVKEGAIWYLRHIVHDNWTP